MKKDNMNNKLIEALIYTRVSSDRQVKEGSGLDSQEQRCRIYAANKGYIVAQVFREEGVSGGLLERPEMGRLIAYVDKYPHKNFVVIVDDISRFAMDTKVYLELKTSLALRQVTLESPNFSFDASPEGELIETTSAATAAYERKKNQRQVIQKQKARMEQGFWCLCQPKGFKFIKAHNGGKVLVRKEPYATIFAEAMLKYVSNYLNTLNEVKEFIEKRYREHGLSDKVSIRGTHDTLCNILYTGYIEYPHWEITRRKARHEGIISLETFEAIQDKMLGRGKKKLKKDYKIDFPLRGFLVCANCLKPLTASFGTGRSGKRHPYYWCRTQNCVYRYKTIPNGKVNTEFESFLDLSKPDGETLALAKVVFSKIWDIQKAKYIGGNDKNQEKINDIESGISKYVNLIGTSQRTELTSLYENKINELLSQKEALIQKTNTNKAKYTNNDFGTALSKLFKTLESPLSLWKSDNINDIKTILNMYFENFQEYDLNLGFGTARLEPTVALLRTFENPKNSLVEMGGIEPPS